MHAAVGQEANQMQRSLLEGRLQVLPALQLEQLAALQRLVHQLGALVHLFGWDHQARGGH